jgi:uncharacterized membrane protein
MRPRFILLLSAFMLALSLPLSAAAQDLAEADDPAASEAAPGPVVRGVFYFSPTCPHCETVINDHLPGIFASFGDPYEVAWDESLPPEEVAFYLLSNDTVQLLMIDASVQAGAELFTRDSERLGIERAGVPRLDIADTWLVGSVDIPARLPEMITDGVEAGGIDWPAVEGIEEPLAWFEAEGLLGGRVQRADAMAAESEDAAAVLPATTVSPLDRVASDPLGNGIAILVLVALLVSLLAVPLLAARHALVFTAGPLVPVLVVAGVVVAAYLASVETSGSTAVCGPVGDCNAVQQSEYSRLLGVPIGVLGVIGYLAIGGLWLVAGLARGRLADRARVAMALGAFAAVAFSAYLTFLEPFVIGATCMWCISSALISLALLWLTAGDGWSAFERLRGGGQGGGRHAGDRASVSASAH